MITVLRSECFRLRRSGLLLLALLVVLAADLFFSSRSAVTTTNMYGLPELATMSEFLGYCEASDASVNRAKLLFQERGAFAESDAEDLIGVFEDTHPYQFRWVLASNKGLLLLIPLVFVFLFPARDLQMRSFYNALYTGKRRRSVFFGEALFYCLVAFVVSLLGIAALTVVYAGTVYSRLPALYVWSRLCLHAFLDCALLAPPFLFAYLLRSQMLTCAATAAYSILLRYTGLIWPAAVKSGMPMWEQGADVTLALLSGAVFLLVSFGLAWLAFEKTELK